MSKIMDEFVRKYAGDWTFNTLVRIDAGGAPYTCYNYGPQFRWSIFTMYWPQIAFCVLFGEE